ncbi:hypothetical protein [Sphingobium ummariense]
MAGVDLHDVPQNRHSADFNHGLGADGCLLAEARTKAAREDYSFNGHDSLNSASEKGPVLLREVIYSVNMFIAAFHRNREQLRASVVYAALLAR